MACPRGPGEALPGATFFVLETMDSDDILRVRRGTLHHQTITRACGHTESIPVLVPEKDWERVIAEECRQVCSECYAAEQKRE